jgi:hypothetical protein
MFHREKNNTSYKLEFPMNTTMEKVKEGVGKTFNINVEKFYLNLDCYKSGARTVSLCRIVKSSLIIFGSCKSKTLKFYKDRNRPSQKYEKYITITNEETLEDFKKKYPEGFSEIKKYYPLHKICITEYEDCSTSLQVEIKALLKVNNLFQEFSEEIEIKTDQTISEIKKEICKKFNEKYKTNHLEKEIKLYYLGRNITKMLKDDTKTIVDFNKLFESVIFNKKKLYKPITFKFSKKL